MESKNVLQSMLMLLILSQDLLHTTHYLVQLHPVLISYIGIEYRAWVINKSMTGFPSMQHFNKLIPCSTNKNNLMIQCRWLVNRTFFKYYYYSHIVAIAILYALAA